MNKLQETLHALTADDILGFTISHRPRGALDVLVGWIWRDGDDFKGVSVTGNNPNRITPKASSSEWIVQKLKSQLTEVIEAEYKLTPKVDREELAQVFETECWP